MTGVRASGAAAVALVVLAACAAVDDGARPAPPATGRAPIPSPPPAASRFFVTGDGTLRVANVHGERATLVYRRADGAYDPAARVRLAHLLRSRDGAEGPIALRLIEVLAALQARAGGGELVVVSGYRSPAYHAALRRRGAKAAGGSMHTEGLAADVAVAGGDLPALWRTLRALDCCGAGLYARDRFLHVDVGRPRFWEATTSRVDENLSAGNARLFARSEFDRYAVGERIVVGLHGLTVPPVGVARTAHWVGETGTVLPCVVRALPPEAGVASPASAPSAPRDVPDCLVIDAAGTWLEVLPPAATGRGHLVLATCAPRVERTPATLATPPLEIR